MKKNKTLRETLEKLSGKQVKIGAKGGSGFYYCSLVHADTLKEELHECNKWVIKTDKKTKANLEERFANLDKIYKERITAVKKASEENPEIDLKKSIQDLKNACEREKVSIPKRIAKLEELCTTHIIDREVVEKYPSILPEEKGCTIVLVKGLEHSKYWTLEEYADEQAKKQKEKDKKTWVEMSIGI